MVYFIFLTELSGAASCVAPASTKFGSGKFTADFYILLVFNLTQFLLLGDISCDPPALVCVGTGDVVLRYKSYTIYCCNPSAHIIIM